MPKGLSPQQLSDQAIDLLLAATGPRPRVAVAFSGGLDSTVLAHMLLKRRRELGGLRLIHVDHGLQAASGDWSRHCRSQARAWRVPFTALRARVVVAPGESPEAVARDARYRLLGRELCPDEVLLTAQHLDDQAETLLLQLFRGAGVAGLAGMPAQARFAAGQIRRPLLALRREDLERYAASHRLEWVEDPSNRHEAFGRNFLRHRVMPVLREKWPGVDRAIARSARHMAEARQLLDDVARADLAAAADGGGISVVVLRALPPARRRNAVRSFIASAGAESPSEAQLREICGPMLAAREDAQPELRWAGATLQRRAGRLLLRANSGDPTSPARETALKSWCWSEQRELVLSDGQRLQLIDDPAGPIDLGRLPARLEVRSRRGGETLRPGPKARTQSLKKLLQAARLTVEERARLPLLFGEGPKGRLIAVGDRWLDVSVMANVKSRRRARLRWGHA